MTSSTDDRRAASSAPRGTSKGTRVSDERALGSDDALGDSRLRDEERARDLVGRQTSEQAQRERNPRLGREHRMTGDEHQAQQVVAHVIVESCLDVVHLDLARAHLAGIELATEFLVLALEPRVSAEVVDRTMLGGGHQPGARVVRNA